MLSVLIAASVLNAPDLSPVAMERACCEPTVALVSAGRQLMPIVAADGPAERQAAVYLASTIRAITGVKPDVYIEAPGCAVTNAAAMRIGRSDGSDRFRVITKDGAIRFLGRSDFAVYDWCERILGVRYYCDGEGVCGKTLRRSRDLSVPAVDYADCAVFAYRNVCRGRPWARVSKAGGEHPGGVNVHAPHDWFRDPEIRTNHPSIFARQPDGSRGEMPLLCYGNPETLEYYKRRIDEHIAGRRDSGGIVDSRRKVITVSPWDCLVDCTCDHCRRLADPSRGTTGGASPIVWGSFLANLAGWVGGTHFDYRVAFLPYLNACELPDGLDLSALGNCEAMVCSMPGLAMFKEPSVREREERLICGWAAATGRKALNWHYGCWPREYTSAPYLFGRTIAAHYRRMAPFTAGSFVCGGVDGTAAEKLTAYVWLKCLWNPEIDVDSVYDEFAARMFGSAAQPMRRLIAMQEDGWARTWAWPHCSLRNVFDISYPAEDVAEMKRLLCEAAERTRGNARAAAHVRWYAADFAKFFADEERYRNGIRFAPLNIARTEAAPAIDGDFDDACWAGAGGRELAPAFAEMTVGARKTEVKGVWTAQGVAFAIRCREPDMAGLNRSAAYGETRRQDTLELFFDASGSDTGVCHRVMVDVRNRVSTTVSEGDWSETGVKSAVACGAGEWRVEIFIPFKGLCVGGREGDVWRGNVVRWHPDTGDGSGCYRLSTLGGVWNQERDAFSDWRFGARMP